jgi:hypothetical protein
MGREAALKAATIVVIVPTLCVGMPRVTLCVTETRSVLRMSYHAERGNDQSSIPITHHPKYRTRNASIATAMKIIMPPIMPT